MYKVVQGILELVLVFYKAYDLFKGAIEWNNQYLRGNSRTTYGFLDRYCHKNIIIFTCLVLSHFRAISYGYFH